MSLIRDERAVDPRQEVARELEPGERVVWAERPDPKSYARGQWAIALFGVPFTAFAIFWIVGAAWGTSKAPGGAGVFSCFPLFGLPFLAVGIGMVTSPLWMRGRAAKCVYAVTDRRVIVRVAKAFGSVEIQSFHPDRLTSMTRVERADGSGDLIFEQFTTRQGSGHTTVRRGFMGLRNVRGVEDLIRKTLLSGGARPGMNQSGGE